MCYQGFVICIQVVPVMDSNQPQFELVWHQPKVYETAILTTKLLMCMIM